MFTYFKNNSVRKLVVAFGNIFNNIKIEQTNADNTPRLFVVPLVYSAKEKFIKRLHEPSSIGDNTRIQISLPRISFELANIIYDPNRRMNKLSKKTKLADDDETLTGTYTETPYNFTFNLNVYTRNIEENLDIIEQILPYFGPEFIVSVNMNDLHNSVDIPIFIYQTNLTQEYEGDMGNRRFIVSTIQFIAKSYIYGRIDTSRAITIIDDFNLNVFDGMAN